MRLLLVVVIGLLGGCAPTSGQTAQAGPDASGTMSIERAREVVAGFKAQHMQETGEAVAKPASTDDVMQILKRDQLELFAAGAAFLSTQEGAEAKALHAQIELAWGDACAVLADVLWEHAARLRPKGRRLEFKQAAGALSDEERGELESIHATIREETTVGTALLRVAAAHMARGSELARQVIEEQPDSYLGYRVAADYYRLRQDWELFDSMIAKIEAKNPKSIGLVFLRGVAAADRDGDRENAAKHFRSALTLDPAFTRAQAQLVLTAETVENQYREYVKLKTLNPKHQIVVWAGERIEKAHASSK